MAKDASYIRVLKFHNKDPSADAFATCASKLGYYVRHLSARDKLEHQDWAKHFVRLNGFVTKQWTSKPASAG